MNSIAAIERTRSCTGRHKVGGKNHISPCKCCINTLCTDKVPQGATRSMFSAGYRVAQSVAQGSPLRGRWRCSALPPPPLPGSGSRADTTMPTHGSMVGGAGRCTGQRPYRLRTTCPQSLAGRNSLVAHGPFAERMAER